MGKNFSLLNIVQFLDALNENLFKYVVIYFLLFNEGQENSSVIMSITGAVFILPFILFSSLGGIFADRWSKSRIIQVTRVIQIVVLTMAMLFILLKGDDWIYLILFIVTTLSAIFGPSKYGIIPELVPHNKILKANGYIAALTFFGIIFGTTLASFLDSITHQNYALMASFCILITTIGTILSFFMSYVRPADPGKKWSLFIYQEIIDSLKSMSQIPLMLTATFSLAYFLFIGAYVQMNIIPYSVETLKMKPIVGGYLFLASAVGVGIGSLLAPRLARSLKTLPFSCMGMSIGCFLFTLFPHPFWINIAWLIILGIFGGLFLVPAQAFILEKSEPQNKGRNFGTANFFSFLGALLAAFVLYLFNTLLAITPSVSFTWIGTVNLGVAAFLFFLTRDKKSFIK